VERYRLQDLLEAREASEQDPVEEEVLETARRRRRWKTVLASGLADVNACLAFTRDAGRDKQIVLAGRAADRAAVRSLWDWLVPQLEWLSATHGAGRDKRWHDDFRIGAIDTILERLRGVHEQERGQLDGAALVRLDPALVERRAALERFSQERLRPGKGRRLLVGVDAWKAGRAAAAEVSIGE
jgi:hypothetical protein